MLRTVTKWVLLLLLLLFVVSLTELGRASLTVVPFGWLRFVARTFPDVRINWSGIGMVALCSAALVFGMQWFLSWLHKTFGRTPERPAKWQWRWTFSLYVFFWILFGVAMGGSGVMRQMTWLIGYSDHLYRPRVNWHVELRHASAEAQTAWLESNGDIQRAQKLLMSCRGNAPGGWDYHQFLFLTNGDRHVEIAIIPRDPEVQRKAGCVLLGENGEQQLTISELLTVLRSNRDSLTKEGTR